MSYVLYLYQRRYIAWIWIVLNRKKAYRRNYGLADTVGEYLPIQINETSSAMIILFKPSQLTV